MDAVTLTLAFFGGAILGWIGGTWFGAKALEAHARAEVAKMLRSHEAAQEQADYLAAHAADLKAKRGG
jgi:uncharacterized membrane protein YoaK (UPF0700 family)